MTVGSVQLFYGVLAVAAIGGMVLLGAMRLFALTSDAALYAYAGVARAIESRAVVAAWLVAALATAGSLYFSEIAGFEPCTLCWYQRIAMYPLVVILGLAAVRRQHRSPTGVVALAAIGALIAGYHVALEWVPSLDTGACAVATPCTFVWFRVFGFISLPTLALTAFLLIIVLLRVRDPDATETWSRT
jgi:disulfide bond formation protein DsbB